jgi:TB2/DP1, HVA22 family
MCMYSFLLSRFILLSFCGGATDREYIAGVPVSKIRQRFVFAIFDFLTWIFFVPNHYKYTLHVYILDINWIGHVYSQKVYYNIRIVRRTPRKGNMIELPPDKILIYAISILCMILMVLFVHRFVQPKRTRGRVIVWHALYTVGVIVSLQFIPNTIQDEIFSPGGVLVVGTLLPIYESIVAICTIGEADDTTWLQYWIASATLSFSTEFVDNLTRYLPAAGEHWYEFEFFFYLWLLLPYTDGAALIYDVFTKPYCAPLAQRIKVQCEGYIGMLLTMANTSYIWILWYSLLYLPDSSKRFLVVALGTVYPIAASLVAVTTESTGLDDTLWLTYWTTFSLLFIAMDYIENFIGSIPGFYSLCAIATVYLFLPMFNGAEIVFRRVLVPLSGQHENMLLHDAYKVKAGMIKAIPINQRDRVFEKTAHIFLKGDKVE